MNSAELQVSNVPTTAKSLPSQSASLNSKNPPHLDFKHVLLCTDFSPASRAATEAAIWICRNGNKRLTVLHVNEYGAFPPDEADENYLAGLLLSQTKNLRDTLEELAAQGFRATSEVLEGNPKDVITDRLRHSDVDLAILGTHGIHGLERFVFGSTAEAVLRAAPCPVLTVGPNLHKTEASSCERPIVFATDFHQLTESAVRYAAELANTQGTTLRCVHVLPLNARMDNSPTIPTIMTDALREVAKRGACARDPEFDILYGSDVSHAIVEYSAARNAAAIVLGVQQTSRLSSHLPPHRTFRILMTAPCPVLTICYETPAQEMSRIAACL